MARSTRLHNNRRVLRLEQLERREVLAGNVVAAIRGGNLFLTGDGAGNEIQLEKSGQTVSITSLDGSTTINGQASVTLTGFTKNMTVNLGNGDDVIRLLGNAETRFRIPRGFNLDLGNGNDRAEFENVAVGRVFNLFGGGGNDVFAASGLLASRVTVISMGGGSDEANIVSSRFEKPFIVNMNAGDDRLSLAGSSFRKPSVLNGGPGFDRLSREGNNFRHRPTIINFEARNGNIAPTAENDTATVNEGASVTINVAANDSDAGGSLDLTSISIVQGPANGSAVANNDGTVTYTHNGSETTSDSFRYTIADTQGNVSGTATVTITVTPVNDAPVAVNDSTTVNEGASATINLAVNDTDAEGSLDLTSIAIVQSPANGTVTVNANGTVSYTHNGSETTSDTFRYTIEDTQGAVSGTATVSVTVTPVNDPPVAVNDTATVNEGASATINLAANDTDAEGSLDLTSITIVQSPANGSVNVNANGTVSYTHNGSETTSDSFRYTIEDTQGAVSGTATVSVTVTAVNDPPVAVNDTATVNEGASATINLAANDTDAEGSLDLASIVIVQNPANGSVTVNANGTVSYTHNGSETTSDSFRYTIEDTQGAVSGTATVSVTVTPVNDPPIAVNDTATVSEGASATINLGANDTDAEGSLDLASIVVVQSPASGSVTVNANGTVSYTHDGSETTSDSFTYTIEDTSNAISGTATVSITVTPVNDAPVAVNDSATVNEGASVSVNVAGNDIDAEAALDLTSVVIIQGPANGSVTVNADGTVSYTHNGSETTSDSFTYTIEDTSNAVSGTATVSITITPVNDPPVAVNDSATLSEGASATINLAANDTDAESSLDLTSITIVQGPANGSLTVNADGTVSFTHNGSETTSDSFTYTIEDTSGAVSGTATVSITVTPVNDAPVAVADTVTLAEGASLTINVAANDTDAEGALDATSTTIITGPINGSATVNADGTIAYTHNGSNTTSDSLTYTIEDTSGAVSNTATVSITVTGVNDPPVGVDDTFDVDEDSGIIVSGNVLTNDSDGGDGGALSVVAVAGLAANVGTDVAGLYGTFHINADGSFTYDLDDTNPLVDVLSLLDELIDTIAYDVSDGLAQASATARVHIHGALG